MTKQEWLEYADSNKDKLVSLLNNYHPVNRSAGRRKNIDYITAPNAEIACTKIRKAIKEEYTDTESPADKFTKALELSADREVYNLLNAAWFGVPESTSCWQIEGFKEAVLLLENPPDEDE